METLDQQLLSIAFEAGLSVAPYLRSVARSAPQTELKRDIHDPVTVHDKHVEAELRQFLSRAVPGSRFLGEEMGSDPEPDWSRETAEDTAAAADLGARVRWILDPIDGTANFAAGLLYFGTSIGVELDQKMVAAVVTVPAVGEAFIADSTSAWHVDASGTRTPLRADGPDSETTAVIATYYPGLTALTENPEQALEHDLELRNAYGTVRSPGAGALDLAHVSAGWLGVSMGVSYGPWDVAAGLHLVRVAGGGVLNLPMGTDLPDGLRPGVVAWGRNLEAKTARSILEEINRQAS